MELTITISFKDPNGNTVSGSHAFEYRDGTMTTAKHARKMAQGVAVGINMAEETFKKIREVQNA